MAVLLNRRVIRIWAGERKLLPVDSMSGTIKVRCLAGKGYLRVMSLSSRNRMQPGDELVIPAGEVATLTGVQTMFIEIRNDN